MKGHSAFSGARCANRKNSTLDENPIMVPAIEGPFEKFEAHGVADLRITGSHPKTSMIR